MAGLELIRRHALTLWRLAERALDAAAGAGLNPLRHLGAIGFLAFWLLAVEAGPQPGASHA